MSPRAASALDVVKAVRDLPRDRLTLVGIDGFGGAGKTTLAARIADAVPATAVVHVDDFWGPNIAEWDWLRFRSQVLEPLTLGLPARYQVWDWSQDAGGAWCDIEASCLLVVEGVSSTRDEVGAEWDLTVWVDAPRSVRLERARRRNPDIMSRWTDDWMPSEERYVRRQSPRDRVDLVVDGTAPSLPHVECRVTRRVSTCNPTLDV